MIKIVNKRYYDIACDTPNCHRQATDEYTGSLGWITPSKALASALDAGWQFDTQGLGDRIHCPNHKEEK